MKLILLHLLLLFPFLAGAHGGEDHGEKGKAATPMGSGYFSSVANSDKYELLLKYAPLKGGKEAVMQLYVSDFYSNKAIDNAKLDITLAGGAETKFAVSHLESGIYEVKGKFPANQSYSLNVNINSANGPDLMVLESIEVGKELPVDEAAHSESLFSKNNILLLLGGIAIGALIVLITLRLRDRKIRSGYAATILVLLILPVTTSKISAHGGEDHSADGKKPQAAAASDAFIVPKESQFLFTILTVSARTGDFFSSTDFLGTVIPSATGMAVIQSPQTGKIVALRTAVGQRVNKGQVLAIIEQSIDAGTQVDLQTQRNNAEAEFRAAKAQYERLRTIADIAAKRDVQEAEARYRSAQSNLALLRRLGSSGGRNSKLVNLTAPISGVVGTFNYAIGATVNTGETLFSITNLSSVYVEAQIYSKDLHVLSNAKDFIALSGANQLSRAKLRMISSAQEVNEENQTQRYIFALSDAGSDFKIGQNITVRVVSSLAIRQLVVPNSAVTDINGKPAVFVKEGPENFSINYIQKGSDNGSQTSVVNGLKEGSRIVQNGTYQMKTMFLNQ
ncbi:MAG TPA: efflux RND transporter periplasmic adaptor subunit [Sphingobacteriaceae bacterium]|nr:efflux RND transporter periplasmic adaptor subunit [Sphingobacteriaceae bacterium]